jgi:hypothetical protein
MFVDKEGISQKMRFMTYDDKLSSILRGNTGPILPLMVALTKLGDALTIDLVGAEE